MSNLLINEPPLLVLPTLAAKIGLHESIMLQQINYWLFNPMNKNEREGKKWVYNTYEQWMDQFPFLGRDTIKRTIKSLKDQGLLITKKFDCSEWNQTSWYTINYDQLRFLETLKSPIGAKSTYPENKGCEEIPVQKLNNGAQNQPIDRCKNARSIGAKTPDVYNEQRLHTETTNNNNSSCAFSSDLKPAAVEDDVEDELKLIGLNDFYIKQIMDNYTKPYILEKLEYTRSKIGLGNPSAYLRKALEGDWKAERVEDKPAVTNTHAPREKVSLEEAKICFLSWKTPQRGTAFEKARGICTPLEFHAKGVNVCDDSFVEHFAFPMMVDVLNDRRYFDAAR